MGHEHRFREAQRALDLRNGHGPAQPLVQWNPVFGAVGIVDSILPGNQTLPIQVQAGSAPVMAAMPDWTEIQKQAAAELEKRIGSLTPDDAHQIALIACVADFQRAAVALAANAKALREAGTKFDTTTEALPEAPAWKPKLVEGDAPNGGGAAE